MTVFDKTALAALADLLTPLPWYKDALCAQIGGDDWFPEKGGSTLAAKKVCAKCPVRGACLEDAMSSDQRYGVWAGLSERERRQLKRGAA